MRGAIREALARVAARPKLIVAITALHAAAAMLASGPLASVLAPLVAGLRPAVAGGAVGTAAGSRGGGYGWLLR